MDDPKRIRITAPAVAVRGNDIDTDRIIPARFLRCVTFDGLGAHAFEDDRLQAREAGQSHPLDAPQHQAAQVLVVNKNFGCGSSREHAPQALMRWGQGIRAVVGESFAEIFFGNCVALGIPCVSAGEAAIAGLMDWVERHPEAPVSLDLEQRKLLYGDQALEVTLPEGAREQFLSGRWDSTAELLDAERAVAEVAEGLPYFAWAR